MSQGGFICKRCIGPVTNGSLVATVEALRTCPSCRQDIAQNVGVGYRMLLLAGQRFHTMLIADEWESQNKKVCVQEEESRYALFGLSLKFEQNEYKNWVASIDFRRAPGGSALAMRVTSGTLTGAIGRATETLREVTRTWPLLPDKTWTNPTSCIVKPGPEFTDDDPTTGVVRGKR